MQKVKDVMAKEVISVKRSTTLAGLLKLFKDFHSFPLVPVTDKNGRLVGSVSLPNILEVFSTPQPQVLKAIPFLDEQKDDIFDVELDADMGKIVLVDDIMNKDYLSIDENSPIDDTYYQMKQHQVERLPVVNEESILVGMIGIFDIVRSLFGERGII